MMKILLLTILLTVSAYPQAGFEAVIVSCVDGDTCDVKHSDGNVDRVRMLGIDAPEVTHNSKEISQPWGEKCRDNLKTIIDGKQVYVETRRRDGYGRNLGRILYAGADVNLLTLAGGCAWQYYPNGIAEELRADYLAAFEQARTNKIGLFAQKRPVTPTVWRKKKHFRRQPKK